MSQRISPINEKVIVAVVSAATAVVVTVAAMRYFSKDTDISSSPSTTVSSSENSDHESCASGLGLPHPFTTIADYKGCIYLDYNATTPIYPEVSKVMKPFLSSRFGNPSSAHVFAQPCALAITTARQHVGRLINANDPQTEIIFTSCGTESDNGAINIAIHHFHQTFSRIQKAKESYLPHIVTSIIEHPAVLSYLRYLQQQQQIELTIIQVDESGVVLVPQVRESLRINTALVSIMHSNNEVGTLQPIREIAQIIRNFSNKQQLNGKQCSILLHSDGAQSLGKVLIDVNTLGVDLFTIVGHKYGAPKGIAALYIKSNLLNIVKEHPLLIGGGQEKGCRGGTENILLITGLGEASRLSYLESSSQLLHLLQLKHRLLCGLLKSFPDQYNLRFNGPKRSNDPNCIHEDLKMFKVMLKSTSSKILNVESHDPMAAAPQEEKYPPHIATDALVDQLPNTISVSIRNVKSHELITSLSEQVAFSAGAACHTNQSHSISSILQAMNIPIDFAVGTLRLSFGRHTTIDDIDRAVELITKAARDQLQRRGQ